MGEVKIKRSKLQLGFVVAGLIPLLLTDKKLLSMYMEDPSCTICLVIGIIGLLFWGGGGLFVLYFFLKNRVGLRVNEKGVVVDNLSIDWNELESIEIINKKDNLFHRLIRVKSIDFVGLVLKDLREFEKKQTKRQLNKIKNNIAYSSCPVLINTRALQINSLSAKQLLDEKFKEWKALQ